MTRDVNTKRCVCLRRRKLPKVFIAFCNRNGLSWNSTCWFATQTPESAPSENVLSLLNDVATPHQCLMTYTFSFEVILNFELWKKETKEVEESLPFPLGIWDLKVRVRSGIKTTSSGTSCPGCATCAPGGSSLCLCQRCDSSSCEPNCERSCCWSVVSSWSNTNNKRANYIQALAGPLKQKSDSGVLVSTVILWFLFFSPQICVVRLVWTTVAVPQVHAVPLNYSIIVLHLYLSLNSVVTFLCAASKIHYNVEYL